MYSQHLDEFGLVFGRFLCKVFSRVQIDHIPVKFTISRNCYISGVQNYVQQECIPVGCVPPAAVAVPGGSTPHPRWTEFLTHASENITLPQTSFADGVKVIKINVCKQSIAQCNI